MKELLATTCNHMATIGRFRSTDGKLSVIPQAELILIVSEPVYGVDSTGALSKSRQAESLRVITTADQLRDLAKQISNIADDIEESFAEAIENTKGKQTQ